MKPLSRVTTNAAKLSCLVDIFDQHFAYNKKRPSVAKVHQWLIFQTAGWDRALWRKAIKQINARLDERWFIL